MMFRAGSTLRGRVRIDMPQSLARVPYIPRLPELLAAHPHLEVQLSTTDRQVDVVREVSTAPCGVASLQTLG
jgi:DNA-binding transcriptional LysR family regulator